MSTYESLTPQIDGFNNTFDTDSNLDQAFLLMLNGAQLDPTDYVIINNNRMRTNFTPVVSDDLILFLSPTVYDISDQINSQTRFFDAVPQDNLLYDFLGIYNGVIVETEKVTNSQFSLSFVPLIGDTLSYMRSANLNPVEINIEGYQLTGSVIQKNIVQGSVKTYNLEGVVS